MVIASALIKTASETAKEIFYGTECVRGGRGCVGVGVCVGGVLQGDMLPPSRGKAQERQRHMKDLIS